MPRFSSCEFLIVPNTRSFRFIRVIVLNIPGPVTRTYLWADRSNRRNGGVCGWGVWRVNHAGDRRQIMENLQKQLRFRKTQTGKGRTKRSSLHLSVNSRKNTLLEDRLGSQGVKPLASGGTSKDGWTSGKPEGQRAFLRCGWLSLELECSESEFHSRNCRWAHPSGIRHR